MSAEGAREFQGARISVDELITAAGQGALRALEARGRAPEKGEGFYVDLHIRCGIPAPVLQQVLGGQVGTSGAGLAGGTASE
jgi:hypothetical protein